MEFKDYYRTLGVDKTASETDIKRAYRKLARESHPDLHAGDEKAEARFKEVNEAYEVLGDPEKRRKYDELGANWKMYEQAGPNGAGRGGSPWQTFTGGGGAGGPSYRTMSPEEMEEIFGTDDPFSDFFHAFFGGGGPSRTQGRRAGQRGRRRGQDVESHVDLTLEEAFAGASRRVRLSRPEGDRTVDVGIPAGVRDGTRVRVSGEGGSGTAGGAAGDLYLRVRILPHARFERRGQDLHTRLAVPVTTAVLGGEVEVPTLSGSTLRLKVPPLTPAGRVFRLKGHGMPTAGKPQDRGDLYAAAEIQIPSTLTDEARAHYEALRGLEEGR